MFNIFIKACKKYGFTYVLTSYNGLSLELRPNNTFKRIEIKQEYNRNYSKLFMAGIKKMKLYRNGGERH